MSPRGTLEPPLFRSLEVETYSRCNLACPRCPVSLHARPEVYLDETVFRSIIDELAAIDFAGTFSPHFYNEPFADERLPALVAYVAERLPRSTIRIFTNTTLLTVEKFRAMAKLRIEEFVVTIDEEPIRRSYQRLFRRLTAEERARIRFRWIRGVAEHNRGGLIEGLANVHRPHACRIPRDYCVVDAHGDVLLCFNDYFARNTFGNVNQRPLLSIWGDPEFVRVRRDVEEGRFEREICRRCEIDATMLPPRRRLLASILEGRRRKS